MRFNHLRRLGHQVSTIDMDARPSSSSCLRSISRLSWKLGWPLDLDHLNRHLIKSVESLRPQVLWIDKGVRIYPSTLRLIKTRYPDIKLVHYNPDDPFGHGGLGGWRRFIQTIPLYNVHFVPRRDNIEEYRQRGASRVIHNIPTRGFDPDIHKLYPRTDPVVRAFACDVGFLGAFEKERYLSLMRLAYDNIPLRVMANWPQRWSHPSLLRAPYDARGQNYGKALSSFKIGLGFLRKANRDQHTSRSIEIPACGTFLLAERTDEHLMLFEEGREAEFFSSDDELLDKVRFYLANNHARESIARAGRVRCLRSGYDYGTRMRLMLEQAMATEV